ncbi:MAG: hypothetical protein GF315_03990, partial [candidate division Zixibacteria bacterium]|nr:hypothetical protein [candidate division Zixibacteria bacterium]
MRKITITLFAAMFLLVGTSLATNLQNSSLTAPSGIAIGPEGVLTQMPAPRYESDVLVPPPNDDCENAQAITPPYPVTVTGTCI